MNRTIFGITGFVLGAAAGALVTWKLIEKKYHAIADEEIASVKKAYSEQKSDKDREQTIPPITVPLPDDQEKADEIDKVIKKYSAEDKPDYTVYSQAKEDSTNTDDNSSDKPYVISPEECNELDDYSFVELTYYAGNGVLVDDEGDPIEDPERIVGDDFSSHFGEYEDDSVFVRNDRLMCDYQILLDSREY